jgi:hypothetical protein
MQGPNLYSPESVEGRCCEVGLRLYGVLRSPPRKVLRRITHLGDARLSVSCYLRIRRCDGKRRMVPRSWDEVNEHI